MAWVDPNTFLVGNSNKVLIYDIRSPEPPRIVTAVQEACNKIAVTVDGRIFVGGLAGIAEIELGGGIVRKFVRDI